MKSIFTTIALTVLLMVVHQPATAGQAKDEVVQQAIEPTRGEEIDDSTLFKLLMLDRVHNLVGIGWEDREKLWGIGFSAINQNMKMVATKRGFKVPTTEQELKVDLPPHIEGSGANAIASVSIPDDAWYELFHLMNWGRLPIIKYRGGTLLLDLKAMKVGFSEGTRILMGTTELRFVNSKWQVTPPSKIQ